MYRIIWQPNAEISYEEEINFIFRKWNEYEVLKFQDLVNQNLIRLKNNPLLGNYHSIHKSYTIVISKQTTLYYNFDEETKVIDLYLFWNNLKNPNDLLKLL